MYSLNPATKNVTSPQHITKPALTVPTITTVTNPYLKEQEAKRIEKNRMKAIALRNQTNTIKNLNSNTSKSNTSPARNNVKANPTATVNESLTAALNTPRKNTTNRFDSGDIHLKLGSNRNKVTPLNTKTNKRDDEAMSLTGLSEISNQFSYGKQDTTPNTKQKSKQNIDNTGFVTGLDIQNFLTSLLREEEDRVKRSRIHDFLEEHNINLDDASNATEPLSQSSLQNNEVTHTVRDTDHNAIDRLVENNPRATDATDVPPQLQIQNISQNTRPNTPGDNNHNNTETTTPDNTYPQVVRTNTDTVNRRVTFEDTPAVIPQNPYSPKDKRLLPIKQALASQPKAVQPILESICSTVLHDTNIVLDKEKTLELWETTPDFTDLINNVNNIGSLDNNIYIPTNLRLNNTQLKLQGALYNCDDYKDQIESIKTEFEIAKTRFKLTGSKCAKNIAQLKLIHARTSRCKNIIKQFTITLIHYITYHKDRRTETVNSTKSIPVLAACILTNFVNTLSQEFFAWANIDKISF